MGVERGHRAGSLGARFPPIARTALNSRPKLSVNLAWLYAGNLVAKVLSMVAFIYLMRTLSMSSYGDLEFAFSVWFVLNLVQDAGLAPWGLREAARHPEQTPRIAATLIALRTVSAGFSLMVLAAILFALDRPPAATATAALFGAVLAVSPGLLSWAFQARDESHIPAMTEIVRYGLFSIVVFGLVRGPQDVYYVPVAEFLGVVGVVTIHHVLLRRRIGRIDFTGVLRRARQAVPVALPFALSSLSWALRTNAPLLALYLYVDSETTGHFAAGHRIIVAGHVFVWLYIFNLMPSLTRAAADPDRTAYRKLIGTSLRVSSWAVLPGCLALSLLAPFLLPTLAGEKFLPGAASFSILVWLLPAGLFALHMRYALQAFDGQRDEFIAIAAATLATIGVLVGFGSDLSIEIAAATLPLSELLTIAVGALLLGRRAEPPRALLHAVRPLLVTAAAYVVAVLAAPGQPILATGIGLAVCALGLVLVDRGLIGEAKAFVVQLRAAKNS